MAADTVSTIEAERDARALHGAEDGGHCIDPAEIAIGVIIGRTSEFFDFFVYAIASVLVFTKLVFPTPDQLRGTLRSFATLGRESCRERGWQYMYVATVAVSIKIKTI